MPLARVPLEEGTVVIGDLHLDLFDEEASRPFAAWLDGLAAPRLVILGDLFEFWVGKKQLRVAGAQTVLDAMKRRVDGGMHLEVLWGNRDFLLDKHFERASGARVHQLGLIGEHEAGPTLFLHGDELCTLDHGYQRFKRVVRSGPMRLFAKSLPFRTQRKIAASLRAQSVRSVASKPVPEKTMQEDAALEQLTAAGAKVLVCGHAHVFRDDPLGEAGRWRVIDGWEGERDALVLDGGDWRPINAAAHVSR